VRLLERLLWSAAALAIAATFGLWLAGADNAAWVASVIAFGMSAIAFATEERRS
jgi:hypothetical protein